MKKIYVFTIVLLIFSLGFTTFKSKKNNLLNNLVEKIKSTAIECNNFYEYDTSVKAFVPAPHPILITRKNANSLSLEDWRAISFAYDSMKKLPITDPTSWAFQDAIHGGDKMKNITWGNCEHGSCFFLAWHRMYLYFFERIMRSKIPSKPTIALPYWNSDIADNPNNDIIPFAFRSKKIIFRRSSYGINYLFHKNRGNLNSIPVNNGIHLDQNGLMAWHYNNATNNYNNFYSFQNRIEAAHQYVHYYIGRDMALPVTAAKDPIFFAHHANIDRLWEKWLHNGPNETEDIHRCNPSKERDTDWWSRKFNFYDENRNLVSMTASEIVNIASQLNYKYQNSPVTQIYNKTNCDTTYKNCKVFPYSNQSKKIIYTIKEPIKLYKEVNEYYINKESFGFDATSLFGNSNFKDNASLCLEFEDVKLGGQNNALVEIFVNPTESDILSASNKSFAGTLYTFPLTAKHSAEHSKKIYLTIDHLLKNNYFREQILSNNPIVLKILVRNNNEMNNVENAITIGKLSLVLAQKE